MIAFSHIHQGAIPQRAVKFMANISPPVHRMRMPPCPAAGIIQFYTPQIQHSWINISALLFFFSPNIFPTTLSGVFFHKFWHELCDNILTPFFHLLTNTYSVHPTKKTWTSVLSHVQENTSPHRIIFQMCSRISQADTQKASPILLTCLHNFYRQ